MKREEIPAAILAVLLVITPIILAGFNSSKCYHWHAPLHHPEFCEVRVLS